MADPDMTPRRLTPEERAQAEDAIDWAAVDAVAATRGEHRTPDMGHLPTDEEAIAARVRMIRKRSGLSQPQFAEQYRIPVGTLRDWEQGRVRPDGAALAYLLVIDREPDAVVRALSKAA
jgi:putative transcriptional regulator